jgi:hypothetical protein
MSVDGSPAEAVAYELAVTAWSAIDAGVCRDPDSDFGYWLEGFLSRALRESVGAERADCTARATRAAAAILHGEAVRGQQEVI